MRVFLGNVVLADVSNIRCSQSIRGQEFLDRKARKLYNFRTLVIGDDRSKTRTSGEHRLLWIFWSPVFHKIDRRVRPKLDRKDLCQFFNPKWPNSYNHALKKPMRVLPVLFRDALQDSFVRVVQSSGQFIQGFPNTWGHASA